MTKRFRITNEFTRADWTPEQRRFVAALNRGTVPAVFVIGKKGRLWNNAVRFDTWPVPENCIRLFEIEAIEPGKKQGGPALAWFLGLADRYNLSVTCKVEPFGKPDHWLADSARLQVWYKQRGFYSAGLCGSLRRDPVPMNL